MTVYARESLSGYIASTPQLTRTSAGEARFYARVRQDHYQRGEDGSYTKQDPTYTDLVMFRKAAERAYAMFRKGDALIAEGRINLYTVTKDGVPEERDQFIASHIGHNAALTRYQVDRTPPTRRPSPLEQALTPPAQNGPHLEAPTQPLSR